MTSRYLITGGTGWIGRKLIQCLEGDVTVVTRSAAAARKILDKSDVSYIEADISRSSPDLSALAPFDVIINLAGESIAGKRWNAERKQQLRDSRVNSTSNLCRSILYSGSLPQVLVSASAIGIYGDRGDETLDENSRPGNDFLADLARGWEDAAMPLSQSGVRVVIPRIGMVLGRDGGAIAEMLRPFRMGVGGRLGNGRQWMSWIHLHDLIDHFLWLIQSPEIHGPVNAVSPNPVRNADFTKALGRAVGRAAFIPAPGPLLRLILGEFANALLASQRVIPSVASRGGFSFRFAEIDSCLEDIV
jgi:uncharacterized protein